MTVDQQPLLNLSVDGQIRIVKLSKKLDPELDAMAIEEITLDVQEGVTGGRATTWDGHVAWVVI